MNSYLASVFQPYLLTVKLNKWLKSEVGTGSNGHIVDVFTYLPELTTFVLSWSSTGSRPINRVFYSKNAPLFNQVWSRKGPFALPLNSLDPKSIERTDIALFFRPDSINSCTIVPTYVDEKLICVTRFLAASKIASDLVIVPSISGEAASIKPQDFEINNPSMFAHLLGRWASQYVLAKGLKEEKAIAVLLKSFSSFGDASVSQFWKRDFRDDSICFFDSDHPSLSKHFADVRESVEKPTHMFSIIARHGITEVFENFPEDLKTRDRYNFEDWEPDPLYQKIEAQIGPQISYFGIPLKVDDCVVGVFQTLMRRGSATPSFDRNVRFARSVISELGRSIDKNHQSNAADLLNVYSRHQTRENEREDVRALGLRLIQSLSRAIVSDPVITCGLMQFDTNPEDLDSTIVPQNALLELWEHRLDLLQRGEASVHLPLGHELRDRSNIFVTIPVNTNEPFILFMYGPSELLTGRTLWYSQQVLQVIVRLAFESDESFYSSDRVFSDYRYSQQIWAKIHDLKNDFALFSDNFAKLTTIAYRRPADELKRSYIDLHRNISSVLNNRKVECDRLLRPTSYRERKDVPIVGTVISASNRLQSDYGIEFELRIDQEKEITLFTYYYDFQLLVFELLRNVVKHFQRCKRSGIISVNISEQQSQVEYQSPRDEIVLVVSDDVPESGCVRKAIDALERDSDCTLHLYVKSIVERIFKGQIILREGTIAGTVEVSLILPKRAISD